MLFAAVLPLLLLLLPLAGGQLTEEQQLPTCYSTTSNYIIEELVVPIQPQEPVTIRSYQGPRLELFCISFEESGPTCASSSATTLSVPQLCYRPAYDSSVAYTCEDLTDFSTNINARITRGTFNGPEMLWLVRWDGTSEALECYPRTVLVRMLIHVRGQQVSSEAVFAILLVIVLLSVFLMILSFYSFLTTRYRQIDGAGAVTIGGPKASFRGPQMPITAPGVAEIAHTKVLLPIREGEGALTDIRSSRFGQLTREGEEITEEDVLMSRGPRARQSPPPPGDGVRDGMFPSPRRRSASSRGRSRHVLGDGETVEGSARRRRGHQRGGSSDREYEGAQFPTQTQWEAAPVGPSGEPGMGMSGAGGEDSRVQTVKYIPRWMQGAFGRGGHIPEVGDVEEEMEDDPTRSARERTVDIGSTSRAFGVYPQATPGRTAGADENLMPGSGNRFGSGLKHRHHGGALQESTPNARRELGYESQEDQYSRGRRRHGTSASGSRRARERLEGRLEGRDEEVDSFRRDKAQLASGAELDSSRRASGRASAHRMDGSQLPPPELRNDASTAQPGAAAFTCKHCNIILTGTSSDPPFCVVTGERHN